MFLFRSPMPHGYGVPLRLPYSVELWDDADSHVEELIALTGDYRVARVPSVALCITVSPNGAPRLPSMSFSCLPLFQ
jgi:hypothetical protein